jgi:germination protein YpeB
MMPSYSLKYDGTGVINYVEVFNKTLIYPDQIKLKIALDDGAVIGIEGQQYLVAHHKRKPLKPKISVLEAQGRINKRLSIKNIRLTLIPMESLKEVLCYEFYCDSSGEKYFVYINAMNGSEERILKIINTSNGELTM